MAIEVTHLGHTYTYRHPAGWSGGEQAVRDKLNESLPAGDYPEKEAEEMAVRRALGGILSGGEAVVAESGRHILGGRPESEGPGAPAGAGAAQPDRILEGSAEEGDRPGSNPDRILDDPGVEGVSGGDPDRILED